MLKTNPAAGIILVIIIITSSILLSSCSPPAKYIITNPPSEVLKTLTPSETLTPLNSAGTPKPSPAIKPDPSPGAARTIEPGAPDVIGIYTRGSKRQLITEFKGPWKRGKDIYIFDVYASRDAVLKKMSHSELFNHYWAAFPKSEQYKIGYFLNFTLNSGEEINMTIRYPKDAPKDPKAHFYQYVEVYTYDNIHKKSGEKFYHLMESTTYEYTLMTSIKLTPGKKISEVSSINLTAFIFRDENDFDAKTGRYTGPVSYMIPVIKEN